MAEPGIVIYSLNRILQEWHLHIKGTVVASTGIEAAEWSQEYHPTLEEAAESIDEWYQRIEVHGEVPDKFQDIEMIDKASNSSTKNAE